MYLHIYLPFCISTEPPTIPSLYTTDLPTIPSDTSLQGSLLFYLSTDLATILSLCRSTYHSVSVHYRSTYHSVSVHCRSTYHSVSVHYRSTYHSMQHLSTGLPTLPFMYISHYRSTYHSISALQIYLPFHI